MARRRPVRPAADPDAPRCLTDEPVSRVLWVHRDLLRANDYNPNHVAPAELELLIVSILADGYTQPIVARRVVLPPRASAGAGVEYEIIDGFHRWLTSEDPRLRARYGGMVPVACVEADRVHQQMSTIRHNRARGQHGVVPMATMVKDMLEHGVDPAQLQIGLGMEDEEVARLADRAGMPVRGAVLPQRPEAGFGHAWVPTTGAGDRGGAAPPEKTRKAQQKRPTTGRRRRG
jgi:ParB-like chromosome segregation protein Spo0J